MTHRRRRFFLLTLLMTLILVAGWVEIGMNPGFREVQPAGEARPTQEALPTRIPATLAPWSTSETRMIQLTEKTTPVPTPVPTPIPDPTLSPTRPFAGPEGFRLIFDETFPDRSLNTEVWNTRLRWGTTNPPELQEYVPEALQGQSEYLNITANKRTGGKTAYTSGVIASFDRFYFQYGYVEVRAKVPKGQGLWPAVWLLAQDPNSVEEIDIVEVLGGDPTTVHTTIHYTQPDGHKTAEGFDTHGPDFSADFHTYAVDWEWDKIIWYIDGKEVFRVSDHVPHEPMYIIANLAVGGVWPGEPNNSTVFPVSFLIDTIRVFTH